MIQKNNIAKQRKILGLLSGILFAVSLYGFALAFRESIRYVTIELELAIWIISEKSDWFYRMLTAGISSTLGFSIFISFLVDRPRQIYKRNTIKAKILNDQRFLHWSFIHWAFALASVFFTVFIKTSQQTVISDTIFFTYMDYILLLIIPVLFLQSWMNIGKEIVLFQKCQKLKSAFVLFIFSMLLGCWSVIDIKINNDLHNKNKLVKYDINLPLIEPSLIESSALKLRHSKSWSEFPPTNIFIKQDSTYPEKHVISSRTKEINIEAIEALSKQNAKQYLERHIYRDCQSYFIDGQTKMKFVNKVLGSQRNKNTGDYFLAFDTPDSRNKRFYSQKKLFRLFRENDDYPFEPLKMDDPFNLEILEDGTFLLDRKKIRKQDLREVLFQLNKKRPRLDLQLCYAESIKYEDYLYALLSMKFASQRIREINARKIFSKSVKHLSSKEKKTLPMSFIYFEEIRNEYPN